jgi:hypothetical protein
MPIGRVRNAIDLGKGRMMAKIGSPKQRNQQVGRDRPSGQQPEDDPPAPKAALLTELCSLG